MDAMDEEPRVRSVRWQRRRDTAWQVAAVIAERLRPESIESRLLWAFLPPTLLAVAGVALWSRFAATRDLAGWTVVAAAVGVMLLATLIVSRIATVLGRTLSAYQDRIYRQALSGLDRAQEQLYSDPVTGLPNRMLFHDRLGFALAQAARHPKQLALMRLELDRFRRVTESLGAGYGDRLMAEVAGRLAWGLRQSDTVTRQGDDGFIILCPEITQADDAARIAHKTMQALEGPFQLDQHEIHLSGRIGVAVYPYDGRDSATLLKAADAALHRANARGRAGYELFSPGMNARSQERRELEQGLRFALQRQQLVLHFQPKLDLKRGAIVGVEALVRWLHPEHGLLPPARFVPLAEEIGLIVPIGDWVLRTACGQMAAWRAAGLPPLRLAVNLSARQLQKHDLAERLEPILAATGLDPGNLELELTEAAFMRDDAMALGALTRLRGMGVRVTVDDFGAECSSLGRLKRLPVTSIKIDRRFVQRAPSDRDDAAISEAIIVMGHGLGLDVTAAGVETEAQRAFLRARGCDRLQGFLISRPLPGAAMADFVRGWRVEA